ncbi:MAG: TonB-dependent receptor plug domain-containing protein, partial [Gemmatimonadetes bacterium]|nr:TonB-dependent receptor plug domain-containing protein [Gemmatimonadota bacterium]
MVTASPVSFAAEPLYDIDIPSLSVAEALNELADQVGALMLFSYDLVVDRQANGVVGRFTLAEALEALLEGSGLSGGLSDRQVVQISVEESAASIEATMNQGETVMLKSDKTGFWKRLTASLGLLATAAIPAQAQESAQQSASARAMLEEVVVTARRREENLQDLPMSIAAITADAMEAQGIYSVEDLSDFVPNLTLTMGDRANNTRVVIRGIGGGHPDNVFVFGSGMYIDGHYIPNSLTGYMSTLDIERVEVLRGPQGTLFGKNVTGGAINIITAKPHPEFESSLTLRAAEDGQQDVRGMLNVPLSDNVFARFSIASEQFDGYYFNQNLGIDTSGTDLQTFNAALRWEVNDNWTLDFSANTQKRRDDNKAFQCNPLDGSAPAWGTIGTFGGISGREDHLDRIYYSSAGAVSSYLIDANGNVTTTPAPGAVPLTNIATDGTGLEADHEAARVSDVAAGTFVNSSDLFTFSNVDVDTLFAAARW